MVARVAAESAASASTDWRVWVLLSESWARACWVARAKSRASAACAAAVVACAAAALAAFVVALAALAAVLAALTAEAAEAAAVAAVSLALLAVVAAFSAVVAARSASWAARSMLAVSAEERAAAGAFSLRRASADGTEAAGEGVFRLSQRVSAVMALPRASLAMWRLSSMPRRVLRQRR